MSRIGNPQAEEEGRTRNSTPRSRGLRERTLVVTGTTGIAAATARRAAVVGARVLVVGIDGTSGASLAQNISRDSGECRFFEADLRDPLRVEAAVEFAETVFGRIDALFNVAGISGRRFGDGPLHECTEEGWDMTFDSNVRSMFLMCRGVIRRMLAHPPGDDGMRGAVLNMASVLAFSPEPHFFATHAYAASKGAVLAMSRSMAAYYATEKIRVNAIAPSLVRTPMSLRARENPEIVDFIGRKQPLLEGLLDAEDIAEAALFLLGAEARAVTGQILTVDGGWSVSGGT